MPGPYGNPIYTYTHGEADRPIDARGRRMFWGLTLGAVLVFAVIAVLFILER